jgi:NAD(P)-dependent dehydrogenase (short-subunit alcohol dehydrogenase family)
MKCDESLETAAANSVCVEGEVIPGLKFANPTIPIPDAEFDPMPKVSDDFSQMICIVVGGSTGIGKAAVDYYKDVVGFGTVIATSRDWSKHPDYRTDIVQMELDVAKPLSRFFFTKKIQCTYGVVHLLHLNAARVNIGTPLGTDMAKRRLLWETNYFGPIAVFRNLEPLFPTEGYARVFVTCSIANDQFIIPNPDGSFQVVEFFEYYASKPAILRFWMALWAQVQNTKVPDTDWPPIRTNLKVCIVNPAQYATQLGYNAIVEDSDFAESRYPFTFGVLGLPLENIGKAFGQLSQLEDPPLINYAVDQTVSPTDPNPLPAIYQNIFYSAMGYISDISVLVGDNAWPPQ